MFLVPLKLFQAVHVFACACVNVYVTIGLVFIFKLMEIVIWLSYVQDAEKYKLGHPSHFHYLNQSKTYELDGVSNAEEYMKTRTAMDIVGISHEEQVYKLCPRGWCLKDE